MGPVSGLFDNMLSGVIYNLLILIFITHLFVYPMSP